jgi:hypothetical protein
MKLNKFIFLLSFIVVVTVSYSFRTLTKNNNQNTIAGTYKYLKDSVQSPNSNFFEEIELKQNNSFIYKNRMGGFMRNHITGNWRLSDDKLILNSSSNSKDTITSLTCENHKSDYFFEVTNQNGHKINYILIVNQDESRKLKEQYGSSLLNGIPNIQNIQIITSSGLYSKVLDLPLEKGKTSKCYSVKINEDRYFENEEWIVLKENKIQPKGMNQKLAEYFLYKVKQ